MSDMKLMDTEDELRFCKDVHKILDDAKKTYTVANEYWSDGYVCRNRLRRTTI